MNRYWLDPRYWASRIVCRFGYHTLACRDRTDHHPNIGRWTARW